MKTYTLRPFAGWDAVEPIPIDRALWLPDAGISAEGRLAYSDDALRVRLTARERRIRAVERGPLGRPCEDSCLEFFLAPLPEDPHYINIEFNPNATLWLGLGDGASRARLLPERDWLSPRAFQLPDGWGIEYSVPYALLRLLFPGFSPVGTLRGNFYKCGDKTVQPHYLAWNPVSGATPNFHQPWDFGMFIFC